MNVTIERKSECAALPKGWQREEIMRKSGLSAGKVDVFYYSPLGSKVDTKSKLIRQLGDTVDLSSFDFQTGRNIPNAQQSLLQQQQQQQQQQAIRSTNMQRSIIEMLPSSVPPNKHPLSIEYSRGMRTDVSLVPPIRQTASIFKQPVTVYKTQDSKSKTDIKHGTLDKPNQLFWAKNRISGWLLRLHLSLRWAKRLEGLRACDVDGVELGPVELPKGLKPVGPNVDEGTLLQSVATSLHVTSQAVTGQQASKAVLQMNPGVFLNPDQPLMHSVNINEDDIRRQEDRVQVARRKLQEALKC